MSTFLIRALANRVQSASKASDYSVVESQDVARKEHGFKPPKK